MSWFQSTNLATFAKSALKEAQKTIDKALDIKEEEDGAGGGGAGRGATGVSAVTDMASEFFASWGVGAGPSSESLQSSASASNSPGTNRAISDPPMRSHITANDDMLNVKVDSSSRNSSLTSDVPVTLLASTNDEITVNHNSVNTNIVSNSYHESVPSSTSSVFTKHTRSLSDTVFHAPDDDTNDNLNGIVQVLDYDVNSSAVVPENRSRSHIPYSRPLASSSSMSKSVELNLANSNNVLLKLDSYDASVGEGSSSASTEMCVTTTSDSSSSPHPRSIVPTAAHENVIEKSNSELLQEIDLDGRPEENSEEVNTVIQSSSSEILTVVESSGLSDGWDWTSPTESCMATHGTEPEGFSEEVMWEDPSFRSSDTMQTPVAVTDAKQLELVPPQEIVQTAATEIQQESLADQLPPPPPLPPPTTSHNTLIPISSSSRPTSPNVHPDISECTPPSSPRVSPNFEMVSSCVVTTGSTGSAQHESSRSSSIVVVSGRESTPNSRGTSGAGSSGSSEGGHDHDIVDNEIPQSPSTKGTTTEDFPRTTKHKKAASTSSSSDIEVIPSDYSSSSSAATSASKPETSATLLNDTSTQTEPLLKNCEVQTDDVCLSEIQLSKPTLDAPDLSEFVSSEVADILAEKEQEVQQLREEGEKLSLKQFELSQVIKKLRAKEKETEGVIKGLRTEMATKNLELEKIMKTFISKEGIEQSQNETISRLNQERQKLDLKIGQLSSELEDANDNAESMKATVENASIEILELKNVISSVQRESAEVDRLTRDKAELISRTESLQKEVDHLRSALNSTQSSYHTHEADLQQKISSLTQKVHQLETSLGDISSEVADATMPLSLEIEKLQAELKQQMAQSDRREQALHSTISDLEIKLRSASEREKSAKDLQIHFQSQHSTMELRIEELEAQTSNLLEQIQQKEEIFGKKIEDKNARCQKLERTVERLTGEVERLSSENDALSNELKAERTNIEVEKRRVNQILLDSGGTNNNFQGQGQPLHHRQFQPNHQRSSSMSTTASSTGGGHQHSQSRNTIRNDNSPRSRDHSPSEHSITSEEASYLDEVFDPTTGMIVGGNNVNRSMTPKSFFESFTSAGFIESLQSQLRLREGELGAFQEELSKNEKIRKQLNEEIANLTMQNQQLGQDLEKMGEMEQKLEGLNKNYNAVLQMYGEKVEEADELRMDLEDVKEMYKTQIEQLLKK